MCWGVKYKSVTLKQIMCSYMERPKMSRTHNTLGAPNEFFSLASIEEGQLIYYFFGVLYCCIS